MKAIRLLFLAVPFVPSLAQASPPAESSAQVASSSPEFPGLRSEVGADLSFVGTLESDDVLVVRSEIYGHFRGPGELGGYLRVPMSRVLLPDEDINALGNLEGGVLYLKEMSPSFAIDSRAGVAFDTAGSLDIDAVIGNFAASIAQIDDVALAVPGNWLRTRVSPMVRSSRYLLRADLGADVPVGIDGVKTLVSASLRAGVVSDKAMAEAYWKSIAQLDDLEGLHQAGLRVRFLGGSFEPFVGLSMPYDGEELAPIFALQLGGAVLF